MLIDCLIIFKNLERGKDLSEAGRSSKRRLTTPVCQKTPRLHSLKEGVFDDILIVEGPAMNRNKGITLIEVIVSIFIVAFMLVGMMRLYSLGGIQAAISRHKTMAVNLAQAEIENIREVAYENIALATYPLTQTVKIDSGETAAAADDIDGTMVTQVSAISEGYKIIVTISWNDYHGALSEVLESTITSYL
ncbi:MAG: prepilin-type N-terminal cleavage/methylation domain-containing protein [Candidatus Omnitrophica bacterium]|nr:prepilin-type N-terminal cleavage/methylation domain-containing protein [Candidatus Omnitrophota bacterium]